MKRKRSEPPTRPTDHDDETWKRLEREAVRRGPLRNDLEPGARPINRDAAKVIR